MQPCGQQQQYRFHRLSEEEEHEGCSGSGSAAPAAAAAGSGRPPGRWCPEESAGFLSRLTFAYVGGLISLGYRKTLLQEDLWDVAGGDSAQLVSDTFIWNLSAAEVGPVCLSVKGCRLTGRVRRGRCQHKVQQVATWRLLSAADMTCCTQLKASNVPMHRPVCCCRAWCGGPCGAPTAGPSS
jgi:hypothetical protein